MSVSGTYNFRNTKVADLIDDSFQRIEILPSLITAQHINSALNSINLILSEWINTGLNLWTVDKKIASIFEGKIAYTFDIPLIDFLEVLVRNSYRNLSGAAFSQPGTGGDAANAFDDNPATACTQTAPDGYIGYDFGYPFYVNMLGIASNADSQYTLNLEYSLDNVNWFLVQSFSKADCPQNNTIWFNLDNSLFARYFRIREIGGATLNIQELYFERVQNDMPIAPISRQEYMMITNKNSKAKPTCYMVDRQSSTTTLYLWPSSTSQYKTLFFTYKKYIQDVGGMTNTLDIPQRFYEALCSKLALMNAYNFNAEKVAILLPKAQESFELASQEDAEKYVPITFNFDTSMWGNG